MPWMDLCIRTVETTLIVNIGIGDENVNKLLAFVPHRGLTERLGHRRTGLLPSYFFKNHTIAS